MKNKNMIYLLLAAGAGYYFYAQSKKKKGQVTLGPLEKLSEDEYNSATKEPEKPKTLLAKAAQLVKKAANTPEGKSLINKGKKLISKKLKLKKMGADYLYI